MTSVDDKQWKDKWEDVYMSHKSLQLPFYACLGNHDYIENPQAQVRNHRRDTRVPRGPLLVAASAGPSCPILTARSVFCVPVAARGWQVEYSQAGMGNGLWIMPARYYTHTFSFGTQTAQFVVRGS